MKKISFIVVLGVLFCSPLCAQSNCSYITYQLISDNLKIAPGCDVNNQMAVRETQTYNVWCVDETDDDNTYFTADPNPSVTSTGQTNEACSTPRVDCYPDFEPESDNAGFTNADDNINRFYLRVWDRVRSGSGCSKVGFQQNFQQCAAVQCIPEPPPPNDCDPTTDLECLGSPIIIDVEAEGFHLTSPVAGVAFDIKGNGNPVQIAWTDAHYHNAFLVLPGADGLVHSGAQLFGNFTPQPLSPHPNGFVALAQYDKPENGGNGDGIIDQQDAVFSRLRLWIDENHDGISQPNELHQLSDFGLDSLALKYIDSPLTDQFGNQFRYKAQVDPGSRKDARDQTSSGDPARWTYDVFLVIK